MLLWQLLIFSTADNSHNESQQTGVLNWVSPYIVSAIYSTEAVAMRLWYHLRTWNVNLIHSHYLPELIWEPLVHINQKISKENVSISPRRASSWFQLTSLPLYEAYLWGVMKSCGSKVAENKRRIIAFVLRTADWKPVLLPFCLRLWGRTTLRLCPGKSMFFKFVSSPRRTSEAALQADPPNRDLIK